MVAVCHSDMDASLPSKRARSSVSTYSRIADERVLPAGRVPLISEINADLVMRRLSAISSRQIQNAFSIEMLVLRPLKKTDRLMTDDFPRAPTISCPIGFSGLANERNLSPCGLDQFHRHDSTSAGDLLSPEGILRRFISWQSMQRYRTMLETETDGRRRQVIENLLAEEEEIWAGLGEDDTPSGVMMRRG